MELQKMAGSSGAARRPPGLAQRCRLALLEATAARKRAERTAGAAVGADAEREIVAGLCDAAFRAGRAARGPRIRSVAIARSDP